MVDLSGINYPLLDQPGVSKVLFHPRPEFRPPDSATDGTLVMIPVEADILIGARFHLAENSSATLLFFHGNGEIVADYDDFGHMVNQLGINFLAVDYRGYGRSSGQPTVTAMMRDCHVIFDFICRWRNQKGDSDPLILMGRSLGSASVLELASHYATQIDGLIVESGFAWSAPLLRLLGINTADIGFEEPMGFQNIDKIAHFEKPTLIIHAEQDHIIPFSDGVLLYETCPAVDKTLLKIPQANHNNIFFHGMRAYLKAITELIQRLTPPAA
ncbi:MAG: alpha/beta fold hydrolase [Desulfobacterales bacterium]|nr:alpha/beta fold hydrolase [Desulfobacterales bacterium]